MFSACIPCFLLVIGSWMDNLEVIGFLGSLASFYAL